jgi:PAS domain S-box-containing protein
MEGILTNLLDDPEIQAVVGNCRDVTERKRVEQELRASEQRYRMVVEHSSDIIALINDEGRWFYASPAAVKTLGYTRDEFAQADMCSLIHPDDLSVLQEGLTRAWRGELSSVTYRYLHKQGFWIMLETTCSALFDDDGIPEMLVCTAHDVTARTELEQRRDEFLSTTSHELRSPLTTIKASLQLAQRQFKRISEEPTEEVVRRIQEMLSMAERQVTVENRLIGDLLDVSRIHQNKLELHLTPCDLLCIVSTTVEDLQAVEQKRLINLDLPAVDGILVVADVDRLGQVLTNYLTNAVKYSPIEQPIDVMLTTIDERVVKVSVRDYGRGLTPQEQEHVWERFYQSPDRVISKGSSGLGLGLYICRSIIEQHKGAVGLESQVGSGSTFWFTLPLQNE